MLTQLRPALVMLIAFTILTGVVYPLTMTGIFASWFSRTRPMAACSPGTATSSAPSLIGQDFASRRYFHPRPSAAGNGYDAADSSGSNLGPTSATLVDRMSQRTPHAQRRERRGPRCRLTSSPPRAAGSTRTSRRPPPISRSTRVAARAALA